MQHLVHILRFGGPYLQPYWSRFAAGVLLGVLFGLTNLSFVWATKTLIARMDAAPATAAVPAPTAPGLAAPGGAPAPAPTPTATPVAAPASARLDALKARLERATDRAVDPWLPRAGRGLDGRQILGGLLLLPLLAALRGFTGYLSSYCLGWVSERIIADLRTNVLVKLISLSLDYFNRATMGDLVTRIHNDTLWLHRCLSLGLSDLIKEPVTIASVLVGLCIIDWQLACAVMVFLPLCVIPLVVLGRKVRRAAHSYTAATVSQSSLMVEALQGIRAVKAFGLEGQQIGRFREFARQIVSASVKSLRARELVNPIVETISVLGLGGLIVFIFYAGTTVPDLVGFLTGVVILFNPIKKLANLHMLFKQGSVAVDRMLELFAEKTTVQELAQPAPLPTFADAIVFEQVSFAYAAQPVLREVTLRIPRGHRLGIAGESGSGKSTLVNLLFRFYDPTAGAIRLDGHDLRTVAFRDLQRLMALVSQEVVIFDLTVAENIACGKPGATPAEIEAAARAAHAHAFIVQLPQGYDTRVGERGVTLSGGQRQRLAIARAFIRDAPILLLDEATASLDSQSEAEVQAAIEQLEANRTVLCVAHRLSTLANMDRIVVLSEGRIVEEGSFGELLRRGGRFAAMAARQGIRL